MATDSDRRGSPAQAGHWAQTVPRHGALLSAVLLYASLAALCILRMDKALAWLIHRPKQFALTRTLLFDLEMTRFPWTQVGIAR